MKVKFCGINNEKFAEWADELGADYLGLLLGITHKAEDKITDEVAKRIICNTGIAIKKWVMVTHLLSADAIAVTLRKLGVRTIQLHDKIAIDEIIKLRDLFPDLYVIKAVHVCGMEALDYAMEVQEYADALILDSRTTSRLGGTGLVHDWKISREICRQVDVPVFLAGGLKPCNVESAIDEVHPYGVDVNSGVENYDGTKNYDLMKEFLEIAKKFDALS